MIRTDWFERWALYSPDRPAITDQESGRTFTWSEANRIINRLARVFIDEYAVERGSRVAILSTNEVEYIFAFFALQKTGAILVPVNYRLAPREVAHILRDCTPRLFIVQSEFEEAARDARQQAAQADARMVHFDGADSLIGRMFNEQLDDAQVPMEAEFDTPCMILYTSGTTGAPKGAIITHGMLFWNSVNTSMRLNIVQWDVTLTFAPFFHTGGWNVLTTPFLHRGAHVVLLKKFDPGEVLRLCDELRVSVLFGVPTMMDMMYRADAFAGVSLDSVRYAIVGGEPMPVALSQAWQEKGVPIRQGYGLTEFGPNVFSLNEEDAVRKIGSIGFPNFYVDTRIVDDADNDLPAGEVGELLLRGPVCTPGYWNNPAATAETIRDGWLHTGDLVRRDEEGYFYVVDRKKDMFISGAENVYPAEVEHFLRTHPDVENAAVIGVSDDTWGEVGKAFIVLNEDAATDADDILAYCRGNLAKFKIPKYVEFVEALPVSDSGKILKKQLKEVQHGR